MSESLVTAFLGVNSFLHVFLLARNCPMLCGAARTSLLTLLSSPKVSTGGDNRCVGDAEAGHPCWIRRSDGEMNRKQGAPPKKKQTLFFGKNNHELMNEKPRMEKEDETNNARHDL